jgi:hypothetical protein
MTAQAVASEIIFLVEEDPEGGYNARAIGESIFTQANSLSELRRVVRDAVNCHYEQDSRPKIRLHIIRTNNQAEDTPKSQILADFRQAWHEAKTGQGIPVAQLWEQLEND